jgi:hypothetical protein
MMMRRCHKHTALICLITIFVLSVSYVQADGGSWSFLGFDNYGVIDLDISTDSSYSVLALVRSDSVESLFKTDDGGHSWDYLDNAPSDLGAVAIDPNNPSVIWAGEGSKYWTGDYVGSILIEIYKSMDGGQTWPWMRNLSVGDDTCFYGMNCETGFNDILIKPDDSDTILMSMKIWDGDLLLTINGFDSYYDVGGPSSTLAVDPLNNNNMYYGTCSNGYVYGSPNGGESWGLIHLNDTWPNTPEDYIGCVYDLEVNLEPVEGGTLHAVYAATSDGLMKTEWSEETGWSWQKMSGLPTDDITALAIDLSSIPGTIYAGTSGDGVFVSQDGGSTWTAFNEGLGNLSITVLAISKSSPKILYAGTDGGGIWKYVLIPPDDIGIYRDGTWFLDLNGNGRWDGQPTDAKFRFGGVAGDIPLTGDWDGTGSDKAGINRNGIWFLDLNGNGHWDGQPTDSKFRFGGLPGDLPIIGDWDGTGSDKACIYRNGIWFLDLNGNSRWDGKLRFGGVAGDLPVTGR